MKPNACKRRAGTLLFIPPRLFLALLTALSTSMGAWAAEPSPSTQHEVEQLLARLGASGCQFQRNGTWHSAAHARAHMQLKYEYLLLRRLVGTTEDFISLAATKSSTSGDPYLVKCGTQEQVPSAAWMAAQLHDVRAMKRDAPAKTH
jgi:Family of unknown function (DUF5329)